jgi:monoamine oxidase
LEDEEAHLQNSDVVIVGAGVAGLSAAQHLLAHGRAVTVLEARDRIGGRIWTLHDPALPVPIELGAEFLHGEARETRDMVARAGLGVLDVNGQRFSAGNGRLKQLRGFEDRIQRVLRRLRDDGVRDRSVAEALARMRSLSREDRRHALRYVEGYHAADPERISEQSIAGGDDPRQMRIARMLDGYDGVVNALSNSVAPRIRPGTVVTRIRWAEGQVEVESRSEAGESAPAIVANAVIVTVPLGVLCSLPDELGHITFDPPLPAIERAASNLAMGGALRVSVRLDEPIWTSRRLATRRANERLDAMSFMHGVADVPFPVWWTPYPISAPVIVGWRGGPHSWPLSREPLDAISAAARSSLAKLLGMTGRAIEKHVQAVHLHDWNGDPYSRGAYSYVTVAGSGAAAALARPVRGTIFFAGEHASAGRNGTVDGAIASGRRAAGQVLGG